ncbi:MAG: hypothetical protein R3B70_12735 [Polyangiaceae bacterium]
MQEAVAPAREQLDVRRPLDGIAGLVVDVEGRVGLQPDLQVARVIHEEAEATVHAHHRALRHACRPAVRAEHLRRPQIRPDVERPHHALRDAPADDHLRQTAEVAVAHERAVRAVARGDPQVAAEGELEGIPVVAEQPHAQAEPQVADVRVLRRVEVDPVPARARPRLQQRDRERHVDEQALLEREPALDVQEELVADDRSAILPAVHGAQHQRVVGVVRHHREVRRQVARDVRRLHAEHPIAGRRRVETIESERRRRCGRRVLRGCGGRDPRDHHRTSRGGEASKVGSSHVQLVPFGAAVPQSAHPLQRSSLRCAALVPGRAIPRLRGA